MLKNNIKPGFTVGVMLLALLFLLCINMNGQINGPPNIPPEVNESYSWAGSGTYPIWSVTDPNVTIVSGINSSQVTIKVSKNITVCSFKLDVSYSVIPPDPTQSSYTQSEEITITVDPFLVGNSPIYPGESGTTVTNKDGCDGHADHNACYWQWSCSVPGAITCGGNCNNSSLDYVILTCPATIPQSVVNNGYYTVYCTKFCGLGVFSYVSSIDINVSLRNPTISGPASVGCGGEATTGLVYTASQVTGATYYAWTVPAGWTITNGAGTNQITVSSNGTGAGNVSVRAYAANGSPVKSALINFPVVCCATDLSVANNVASGSVDKEQAAHSIDASGSILAGGSGEYHAGQNVHLIPGFTAQSGSYFHGYIEGCTNSYYRQINPRQDSAKGNLGHQSADVTIIGHSDQIAASIEDPVSFDGRAIILSPNPNNGSFSLKLPSALRSSDYLLTVELISGEQIYSEKGIVRSDKIALNLNNVKCGMYILKLSCNDKLYYEKFVVTD